MTDIVEGFDDRDWNGYLSPALAKHFKLIGVKVSQGRVWNPKDRAVLQKQWRRAKVYDLLRIPFHYWLPGLIGTDSVLYGKNQAKNFHDSMIKWNDPASFGWGELPPCIDVESLFVGMAGPKNRALCLLSCLKWTEDLWQRIPMIYTATWYWDRYMHTEFVKLVPEYWKIYDLWEADPLPDTDIAGWGKTNSVQQMKLDVAYPGYGSNGLDLDETTQAWIDSRTQSVPIPIPDDCEDKINTALVTQKIQLEGDHLVDLEVAKKNAYNIAIGDSTQAVQKLHKD